MLNGISAVLIDTSAYGKYQYDFCGINSSIIPTFLSLLCSNNIILLNHSVLYNEIEKRIKSSDLVCRIDELQKVAKRCKKQLEHVCEIPTALLDGTARRKLEEQLCFAHLIYYQDSVLLPIGNAQSVFDNYFKANPPFQIEGKKKNEFPDAFIIQGLIEYCANAPKTYVLVISDDKDWHSALSNHTQITMAHSIGEAMGLIWSQLNDKGALIETAFHHINESLKAKIEETAIDEAYCLPEIGDLDDYSILSVEFIEMVNDYVPLEICDDHALVQIGVAISVSGQAQFLDETRSVWDSEDCLYLIPAYSQVKFCNAEATITCEVRIGYPKHGIKNEFELIDLKVVYDWEIELYLSENEDDNQYIKLDDKDYLND